MDETLAHNWGWVALRGLIAILFGLLTLFNPGITLVVLVLMFGAFAFVDGLFMVISAIANRHGQPRWVASLIGGLLAMAVGVLTFSRPGLTGVALLWLIAAWAIGPGLAEIVTAFRLRKVITGEWLLALAGALAVAFGVILVARPGIGALALALWIGMYALASGVVLIALGFRLRSWARLHPHGAERLA
ncbi:MAG TPA: HdeD family acid-resistance protein [Gemmatimonadaceae bacterium]|nr:HdeD family acid-resistance protein [Gemmatimonadaceae bacterium]